MKLLIAVLAVSLPALPGCSNNPVPRKPFDCTPQPPAGLLQSKAKPEELTGKYIVVLRRPVGARMLAAPEVQSVAAAMTAQWGLHEVKSLGLGFVAAATVEAATQIALDPRVQYVQPETTKSIGPPIKAKDATSVWGLDRIDQRDLPLDAKYDPGATGKDVHLFGVDTGINCDEEDLGGRCGEGHSAIGGTPEDGHGHGTHTAGTMVGTKYGVAKEATIHPCRFLDRQGSGTDSGAVECIEWVAKMCKDNNWHCIENNSWGGSISQAVDDAMCRSIEAGIVQANAAGNSNLKACNYSPSRIGLALVSGASDDRDNPASFSNDGECLSVYAPGVDVESIGGTMSGTSMASPHSAGVAALCWARHPELDAAGVKACVVDHATPGKIGDGGDTTQALLYAKEP